MKPTAIDLQNAVSALLVEREIMRKRARVIALKLKRLRAALDLHPPIGDLPADTPQGSNELDAMIDAYLND
jgi:hypothetical protein